MYVHIYTYIYIYIYIYYEVHLGSYSRKLTMTSCLGVIVVRKCYNSYRKRTTTATKRHFIQ